MKIAVLKDNDPAENRVPLLPDDISALVKDGVGVFVETGMGESIGLPDSRFTDAGAEIIANVSGSLADVSLAVSIRMPLAVNQLPPGITIAAMLDPYREPATINALASAGVHAISLDMIPRTTLAQKMDVLSSQANLAGYAAVVLAASVSRKVFPMMSTPAGTIPPARVFVIGAGVAGLQAIATAKRLGAVVEAFDTRPEVEEQIQSLGARYARIDLGKTESTKDGYAKQLSDEQIRMQREAMARYCASADIVITTAQVFGKPAPRILTDEMTAGMKAGSVIVDMAVDTGGNVEGSEVGKHVKRHGVTIIGASHLPRMIAQDASRMFSGNVRHLLNHFRDGEDMTFRIDPDDDIMKGCLVTWKGEIVHEGLRKMMTEGGAG